MVTAATATRRTAPREYVGVYEAARYVGCSPWLIQDRIRRGQLTTFSNPLDRRYRLIRCADLDALGVVQEEPTEKR